MSNAQRMKVTYATMSADNEELQSAFDQAIARVKNNWLGAEVPMFIDGQKVYAEEKFESYSPINTDMHLCTAQKGTAEQARSAIAAARTAFSGWSGTPWQERVAIIRNIAEKISDNSLELSAIMILEVGKSRLEALGEVEETADLLRYYANSMEQNNGFVKELGKLNPNDPGEHNYSVLHPYGVWVVISPFNFPMALSGAPIACRGVSSTTRWRYAREAGKRTDCRRVYRAIDHIRECLADWDHHRVGDVASAACCTTGTHP